MPIIDAAGAAIYYETVGSGDPLVLIPGFASGAWSWFCQGDLAKDLCVITFDPSGIGRSRAVQDANLSDISMTTFVDDVLRLLNALKIEKAHILGASFGGFVAQEFALRFPARVLKLILACTTAGGKDHVSPDIEILRLFTRDPEMPLGEQIRRFLRPAFTERFSSEHAEKFEKVCRLREENEVSDATYLAQLQTAFSFDVSDRLGEIRHETLVITGDADNLVPTQNSVNLAVKLPDAKLSIIENAGHMIFIENAVEFNKIVSEFLI